MNFVNPNFLTSTFLDLASVSAITLMHIAGCTNVWKFYSFKRRLRAMFSGLLGYDLLRSGLACCYDHFTSESSITTLHAANNGRHQQ